jgi:hypothetical protein
MTMPKFPNRLRRAAGRETPPDKPAPGSPSADRMLELMNLFLAAQPAEMRRLIEAEGEVLLNPAVEASLREAAGESEAASFYTAHADLLVACRAHGVSAVSLPSQTPALMDDCVDRQAQAP